MRHQNRLSSLPLGALRAFDAAARSGSFKAAAAELAVTPAAISHQVKTLEGRLGANLFERLNRSLRLTPAGARLASITADSFGRLEQGLRNLESAGLLSGPSTLSISAAPSFAARWLVPRLHRFQTAHPNIDLRLQAGDPLVDLANSADVDVALRYGTGAYGNEVTAERLWSQGSIIAVCAPSLAQSGKLREPADVLQHPLLRTAVPATPQQPGREPVGIADWAAWLYTAGVVGAESARAVKHGPLFGTSQLALESALAGRGLALVPRILVVDDLAAGRLVTPIQAAIADPYAYWLAYATSRAQEPRIRAFIHWIRDEAHATEGT
jgi:LysR family transcriptional regulator, glycine cleavage system transcriptional activator